jgi:anti-sigma B factor antagonist
MESVVERVGDVAVATLVSEYLDVSNADAFRSELGLALQDCHKLILDLGHVQFVDSRGCGAIIGCLKQLSAAGGDLKLCQVQPPVRTVFELIRLHRICEITATREEALKNFGGAA